MKTLPRPRTEWYAHRGQLLIDAENDRPGGSLVIDSGWPTLRIYRGERHMTDVEYKALIEAVCMWFGTWRSWEALPPRARFAWFLDHWRDAQVPKT